MKTRWVTMTRCGRRCDGVRDALNAKTDVDIIVVCF